MKYIFTVLFLVLAMPVMADNCDVVKKLSAAIMNARQNGVEKDLILDMMKEQVKPELHRSVFILIEHAYSQPLQSENHKDIAIKVYSEQVHAACVKS